MLMAGLRQCPNEQLSRNGTQFKYPDKIARGIDGESEYIRFLKAKSIKVKAK